MTPQETLQTLQERRSQFETLLHTYMDRLLTTTTEEMKRMTDGPQARQAWMQPIIALTDARDAYRQALTNAAPHVTQEVGEDYVKAARELPAQMTFLLSTLSAYRQRKTEGEAGE